MDLDGQTRGSSHACILPGGGGATHRETQTFIMKIAMFSWETLHSHAVGGIAVHVTELAAALERRGHQVHVTRK